MTVTYTAKVATTSLACFIKLLLRWRGSIYKLLWKEVTMFIGAYYIFSFTYRFGLSESQKRVFEMVSRYCEVYNNLIPVAFVLGFYVSLVVSRWWEQFNKIPWPDRMGLFVTANVHGHDERGRLMRRTIMRYLCLSYVITLSSISTAVKKRFPTFQHMTEAGFMNPNEEKILEQMKTSHNKYFVPLVWTTSLVTRARKEGRIRDDFAVKTLVDEINEYRGMLGTLFNYDWISVPLVYTQVTTIAVYMFVLSCLMGRQFTHQPNTVDTDLYVPIFTFLQISFYIGWLKVAEVLVNPFGEDDDDFEMNWVIDRNLQVSYLIVDEMHAEHPELIKDQYWDDTDFEVPYTAAAEHFRITTPPLGSAMDISLEPKEQEFVPLLSSVQENVGDSINASNDRTTSPADIPIRIRPGLAKSTSITSQRSQRPGNAVWNFLKRSVSKDSRMTNMDSPRVVRPRRYRRFESITTQTATPPGSPTIDSRPDEMFNMDDVSDVWGGAGSPYSERRDSWESKPRGRKKQAAQQPEEKHLLPDEAVSKQSLWSSKSSLPSITEDAEERERERHKSNGSASTTTTASLSEDDQYDTVKRLIPGLKSPLQPLSPEIEAEAQGLTPHRVIVFDRGGGGSTSKLVSPTSSGESTSKLVAKSSDGKGQVTGKPPAAPRPLSGSSNKFLPRRSSTPYDEDVKKQEDIEMDVRRTVSLHDQLKTSAGVEPGGQAHVDTKR